MLDLSKVQTSYVEENPRFSDNFFTKYSLPFEFYLDRDLRKRMGHYDNLNAADLAKKYDGYHVFEGRVKKGTLEILEVEGSLVRAQIDSGFEELPNFEKKLSELPFGRISVSDIYKHADEVCQKSYPEVSYNFPRIIFNKHQPTESGWELFNQFINDRDADGFIDNNEDGSDWEKKSENDRNDADKFPKNRNIVHPMPYVLHVLKTGFLDAGYELHGDILHDKDFLQRVVFSTNANYFQLGESEGFQVKISESDDDVLADENLNNIWLSTKRDINITIGTFLLQGVFNARAFFFALAEIEIKLNDLTIFSKKTSQTENIFFTFKNSKLQGVLSIEVRTYVTRGRFADIVDFNIDYRENVNAEGDKIKPIKNRNSFSLSEFVPDMTFGDFVRTLKNWKNYDIDVVANTVVMNYLSTESVKTMKDISDFEIETPVKTFVKRRSFNISFPKLDNDTQNNAFVDIDGVKLGGAVRNETTEIEINGYCLPLETYRGKHTAAIKSEDNSILGLVYYDGLSEGQNFAKNPGGLMLPDILSVLLPWYQMRIVSNEFRWAFYANKNKWRHVGIKDTLYVYGRKVWIKEITKTVIDERLYQIEIAVESIS